MREHQGSGSVKLKMIDSIGQKEDYSGRIRKAMQDRGVRLFPPRRCFCELARAKGAKARCIERQG